MATIIGRHKEGAFSRITLLTLLTATILLFFSYYEKEVNITPQPHEVTIGIAWRSDTDSEFLTNIQSAFSSIGVKTVLLPQVVDNDIPYTSGQVSVECIDQNDVLIQQWADMVKQHTYTHSNVAEAVKGVVAVVFTGGEDIAPTLYRTPQPWHAIEAEKDYNATRDINDYLLMSYCIDQNIPIAGFCRGAQMLGIVSGGTVIQDIPTWFADQGIPYRYTHRNEKSTPQSYRDYAPHDVTVTPGSWLAKFAGTTTINNAPSWHHQSLETVDTQHLRVTGITHTEGFDFIEAIERTDCSLAIGMQFHPEAAIAKHQSGAANETSFMDYIQSQAIFRNFVHQSIQVMQGR